MQYCRCKKQEDLSNFLQTRREDSSVNDSVDDRNVFRYFSSFSSARIMLLLPSLTFATPFFFFNRLNKVINTVDFTGGQEISGFPFFFFLPISFFFPV